MRERLLVRVIQILVEDLRHGEHMNPILLEYCAHQVVTSDLAPIVGVLEIVGMNVLPKSFHRLRS